MEVTAQGNQLMASLSTREDLPEDGQKILSVLQNAEEGSSSDDLAAIMEDKDDTLDSQQWEEVIEGLKDRELLSDTGSLESPMEAVGGGSRDTLAGHPDDAGHLMLRPRGQETRSKDCTRCGSTFTGNRALSDIDLCIACAGQDFESVAGNLDNTIAGMGITLQDGEFSI
tara:strand:- start:825 stop:1334 length:510 start_codon:yes stop_codon:yes gene_type:complete